jgi:tetratricopeptide (TPR) repeat protein
LQEASDESDLAIKEFNKLLEKDPYSLKALINLGDLLAENGRFAEAAPYFQRAVNLNPTILPNQFKLIQALEYAGMLDPAIQAAKKAMAFFTKYKQKEIAAKFRQYLEMLEFKKSKSQK